MGLKRELTFDKNHFLNVYCAQVEEQCRAALGSLDIVMRFSHGPWDRDVIFWNLDHAINRAAMVSKMLWPGAKGEFANQRGEILREALAVCDDSPLKLRALRNHLEHFDDRLDKWYQESGYHIYADRNIGSRDMMIFPGNPNESIFRHYSPEEAIYSFHGDEMALTQLKAELERVLDQARKHNRRVKLGKDSKLTFEPTKPQE